MTSVKRSPRSSLAAGFSLLQVFMNSSLKHSIQSELTAKEFPENTFKHYEWVLE